MPGKSETEFLGFLNDDLCPTLIKWLGVQLPLALGPEWWDRGVLANLSENQLTILRRRRSTELKALDLSGLLRVAARNQRAIAEVGYLPYEFAKSCYSVIEARNALSHLAGGQPLDPHDLLFLVLSTRPLLQWIDTPPPVSARLEEIVDRLMGREIAAAESKVAKPAPFVSLPSPGEPPAAIPAIAVLGTPYDAVGQMEHLSCGAEPPVDSSLRKDEVAPPITHGRLMRIDFEELAPAILHLAIRSDEDEELVIAVRVPPYLHPTARAAAEMLAKVQDDAAQQGIPVALINAIVAGSQLQFPESLSMPFESAPLLVLYPAYLVNVTALTHFDFCARNFLLDRYLTSPAQMAGMRGSVVHEVLEPILKGKADPDTLRDTCLASISRQLPQMVMEGIDPVGLYDDARHHLNALVKGSADWDEFAGSLDIQAERFLINPDLGLKGKIDALVLTTRNRWRAVELKTGKSWGERANRGHEYQVSAYHLLLHATGMGPTDPPCVIYTGDAATALRTPGQAMHSGRMIKQIACDAERAVEIINLRNELVRIDYCGEIPFNDNANKCKSCEKLGKAHACVDLHLLGLGGGDTEVTSLSQILETRTPDLDASRTFGVYNSALLAEFRHLKLTHGTGLSRSTEYRIAHGSCAMVAPLEWDADKHLLTVSIESSNISDMREGDPALLSDKQGPVKGHAIEVWVVNIDRTGATVRLPHRVAELPFTPVYLDRNSPEAPFERQFAALYALWGGHEQQRESLAPIAALLGGLPVELPPNNSTGRSPGTVDDRLLPDQAQAVRLAQGLSKILLIQGPPGTGKTTTLAHIVKTLANSGARVMVATYTHRAAEEVMHKLETLGTHDLEIRKLGRADSTAASRVHACLDNILVADGPATSEAAVSPDTLRQYLSTRAAEIADRLAQPSVYVGTVQAWISGNYDHVLPNSRDRILPFDIAIIDEASQVIAPALVGALRLASKWILVGDHRQLPPIILAPEARVLARTVFECLCEKLAGDTDKFVRLSVQHRMPSEIADFVSETFYGGTVISSEHCRSTLSYIPGVDAPGGAPKAARVIDTGAVGADRPVRQFPIEAQRVVDLLREIKAGGTSLTGPAGKPSVGVIAPYRAQVALLRRLLESNLDGDFGGSFWEQVVDTVDRFQGDEREIIIISMCVDAHASRVPSIYQDERRLNVALSRARQRLIVVGDVGGTLHIPVLDSFCKRFQPG